MCDPFNDYNGIIDHTQWDNIIQTIYSWYLDLLKDHASPLFLYEQNSLSPSQAGTAKGNYFTFTFKLDHLGEHC